LAGAYANSKSEAQGCLLRLEAALAHRRPNAVACVERDLDALLHFFAAPQTHWIKVRTTHVIERAFREVRRRTRPVSSFSNVDSCDRIVYGVISHLNVPGKENRSSNLHKTVGTTLLFELDNFQTTCRQYCEGITVRGVTCPLTDS
jgi:transposase-like protein